MEENQKKRSGFGSGMFVGFLLGILLLGIGVTFGVHVYTTSTNQYLVISPSGVKKTAESNILTNKTVKKIDELMSYIDLYYNDDCDEDDIRNAIYAGTLEGLGDPYSVYYTADEYKDMQISTSGKYYGIGAALGQDAKTKEVTISKVYEGTPAEEAGLRDGDQIVKVNDTVSTSEELSDLVQKIRGEEGTTVHLKIYRASTKKTFEVDVERKNVELPSITSKMLDGGIGYIQISEFQSKTEEQFKSALADLKKQGMKSLIVDVRSNPGGLITAAANILDQILPEGTVVYTEDKYGKREDYASDSKCLKCPIAVLVNENSASASEIFAGAIKDYNYGTLIGTTTFGKGIVQNIMQLKDGSAIKLTVAKYYTPNGDNIHGTGITPDVEIEYEYTGDTEGTYDEMQDNQILKAIEVLNGEE